MEEPKDNIRKKKPRWKRLLPWLVVDLLVAAILVLLLFYKPAGYQPLRMLFDADEGRVHPYLSKELLPQFNNGVQSRRPFRLTILEKPLNEVVAQSNWAQAAAGVSISKPQIVFEPNLVVLMGTATIEGAPLIVTIELQPQFAEKGLLNLNVEKVRIGAMNITPLAKMLGKEKYEERLAAGGVDPEDIRSQITASLLTGRPFDPVLVYDQKKIRVKSVVVSQGRLDVEIVPARDQ